MPAAEATASARRPIMERLAGGHRAAVQDLLAARNESFRDP
jgi:hypothetical protein